MRLLEVNSRKVIVGQERVQPQFPLEGRRDRTRGIQ